MSRLGFLAATLLSTAAVMAQGTGPSSSTPAYVIPNASLPPGSVTTTSLLTTGDSVGGYRLVGIPDGLGAFSPNGTPTILVNYEINGVQGIVRAHGATGAFVSRFTFDPGTKAVLTGRDHNTSSSEVHTYDRMTGTWFTGPLVWDRFCSATLAAPGAYRFGALGTDERIYLCGEEARPPFVTRFGTAWAHIVTGASMNESWELPHLGQISFENAVASPFPQAKTVVVCLDDADGVTDPALTVAPSEVYVYIGQKQAAGNDITKAGLVGGSLYGVRVRVNGTVVPAESNATGIGGVGTFELVSLGNAATFDGFAQQTAAIANDILRLQRVEDGAFDPRPGRENDFYFNTTASTSANSRLWRLRFTDITQPELGGMISIILNGSEGQQMLDNLCIDSHGRIFLQEDPGGSSRLAKIWMYDLVTERLIEVAAHDPALFEVGAPGFLTTDEESSGVIPAFDLLGDGWYLFSDQVHAPSADPELVQGGQLIAMYVKPTLGRNFELWFTSPLGAGSVAMNHMYGSPGGLALSPVSLLAGNFPNGFFFGIDISFFDIITQASAGAPILAALDSNGALTSATYAPLPSGLTLYSVSLDNVFNIAPRVSAPVSYVIP